MNPGEGDRESAHSLLEGEYGGVGEEDLDLTTGLLERSRTLVGVTIFVLGGGDGDSERRGKSSHSEQISSDNGILSVNSDANAPALVLFRLVGVVSTDVGVRLFVCIAVRVAAVAFGVGFATIGESSRYGGDDGASSMEGDLLYDRMRGGDNAVRLRVVWVVDAVESRVDTLSPADKVPFVRLDVAVSPDFMR